MGSLRIMRLPWTVLVLAAAIAAVVHPTRAASSVVARVGDIKLSELVRGSDVISTGRVTRIQAIPRAPEERPRPPGAKRSFLSDWRSQAEVTFAEAELVQLVKGEGAMTKVCFLAEGTWTCDISDAELNETALFFLDDLTWIEAEGPKFRASLAEFTGGAPVFCIAHSGRGRMPLRNVDGRDYATYWTEVVMPADLPSIDGPEAQYASFIRSAPLSAFESKVREHVAQQGAMLRAREWKAGEVGPMWTVAIWADRHCEWMFADLEYGSSILKENGQSPHSLIENGRFPSWPDPAAESEAKERRFMLDAFANGHRRAVRLPEPSTLKAPLDPMLEDALREWLAILDLAESPDAVASRAAYRALLSK